jgi:hypothetical protein
MPTPEQNKSEEVMPKTVAPVITMGRSECAIKSHEALLKKYGLKSEDKEQAPSETDEISSATDTK